MFHFNNEKWSNGINNGKKTPEVSKNQFPEAQLALILKWMPFLKNKRLRQGPIYAIQSVPLFGASWDTLLGLDGKQSPQ